MAATSAGFGKQKVNMIKLFLGFICAIAICVVTAHAQSSSTTTTTAGGDSTTTTTENNGTVTEFVPGTSIVLSTGTGEPVHYKFSKTVTYVTSDGKVIESSRIRKSSKVRVHYIKDGNDMVVDRVIYTDKD